MTAEYGRNAAASPELDLPLNREKMSKVIQEQQKPQPSHSNSADSRAILTFTTEGSETLAAELARNLVEKNLAACVQIMPGMRSFYRWEGRLEDSQETLILIKTRAGLWCELEKAVHSLHSYDTPELLAFSAEHVSKDYLVWMLANTRQPNTPEKS